MKGVNERQQVAPARRRAPFALVITEKANMTQRRSKHPKAAAAAPKAPGCHGRTGTLSCSAHDPFCGGGRGSRVGGCGGFGIDRIPGAVLVLHIQKLFPSNAIISESLWDVGQINIHPSILQYPLLPELHYRAIANKHDFFFFIH